MAVQPAAAYRAWASFAGAPLPTRAFLAARLANAPIGALESELRALRGRVLSLGSGHGLVERYLAEINPDIEVVGLELDGGRVATARATQAAAPRVEVRQADVTQLGQHERYSAALAVDVLHHIPSAQQPELLRALLRTLEPAGVCLVKDIAPTPRWQYQWNRIHDRIVAGENNLYCRSPQEMAQMLLEAGFARAEGRRIARVGLYPHYLVRAVSP